MTLKTLRKLTWLALFLCFVTWLATAGPLHPELNGAPARLVVPNSNDPAFLS